MRNFFVISVPESGFEPVLRTFQGESLEHVEEQFNDAIHDERISWILDSADSKNFPPMQEAAISKDGASKLCREFCKLQASSMQRQNLVAWTTDLAVESYKFPGTDILAFASLLEDISLHFAMLQDDFLDTRCSGDQDCLREFLGKNLEGSDLEIALQLLEI